MEIADVLLAIASGDRASARSTLAAAPAAPGSLADGLARYLDADPDGTVYEAPEAFRAFIDGGGNIELYRRLIELVSDVHRTEAPESVLDIGCGDGRVTAAVLTRSTVGADLVEPSAELLATASERLPGPTVLTHEQSVVDFLERDRERRWDLAQATFALHTLTPSDRRSVLAELAGRTSRLIVAEFDVPGFADRSPEHARYAAERYERGLAEYRDPVLVGQGFLMPVLVGQFDPTKPRHTFEQPLEHWVADLSAAGFDHIRSSPIDDYWWAPAVLIRARGRLIRQPVDTAAVTDEDGRGGGRRDRC